MKGIVENVATEFTNRSFKDLKIVINSNFILNVIGSH